MLRPQMRVISKRLERGRCRQRSGAKSCQSFERTMKTLLLQNQQIIIQQQNMMFMIMKQFHPQAVDRAATGSTPGVAATSAVPTGQQMPELLHSEHQHHYHHHQATVQLSTSQHQHSLQQLHSQLPGDQQHHDEHHSQQLPHHQSQQHDGHHTQLTLTQHQIGGAQQQQQQAPHQHRSQSSIENKQQVATPAHLQPAESIATAYLTPVASEQDPISDTKPDEDDISAILGGDGLLTNNLLYNPQTDIGQITPYKNQSQTQHQTPSYYSSGCESLTTPRVDQQQQQSRQPMTANINQNVVKNLADSFKSPSKPKINVQILSGSATRSMKNNKAKIIQRMNISEFLRHVHQDDQAHHPQLTKNSATQ